MQKIALLSSIAAVLLTVQARHVEIRIAADGEFDLNVGPFRFSAPSVNEGQVQVFTANLPEDTFASVSIRAKSYGKTRGLIAAFYTADHNLIGFTSSNGEWSGSTVDPAAVQSLMDVHTPITQACDHMPQLNSFHEYPTPKYVPAEGPNSGDVSTQVMPTFSDPQWIWPNGCTVQSDGLTEAWFNYNFYVPSEEIVSPPYESDDHPLLIEEHPPHRPPKHHHRRHHHHHQSRHHHHAQHEQKFHVPSFMAGTFLGLIFVLIHEVFAYLRMRTALRHHPGHGHGYNKIEGIEFGPQKS